jgi:hypothetical protein
VLPRHEPARGSKGTSAGLRVSALAEPVLAVSRPLLMVHAMPDTLDHFAADRGSEPKVRRCCCSLTDEALEDHDSWVGTR